MRYLAPISSQRTSSPRRRDRTTVSMRYLAPISSQPALYGSGDLPQHVSMRYLAPISSELLRLLEFQQSGTKSFNALPRAYVVPTHVNLGYSKMGSPLAPHMATVPTHVNLGYSKMTYSFQCATSRLWPANLQPRPHQLHQLSVSMRYLALMWSQRVQPE